MEKISETAPKADLQQSADQPLIIGNINAANLITSNVTSSQCQNSVLIPTNLLTLPTCVSNDNQVIGILPIILQGSQIPGSLGSSQLNCLNSNLTFSSGISNNRINNFADSISSQPIYNSSSVHQESTLVSSDTLILSTSESASKLASADTIPLLSSVLNVTKDKSPSTIEHRGSKQPSLSFQTAFSLVSNVSNRNVDLNSIPTVNLFKPSEATVVETVNNDKNKSNRNKASSGHLPKSSNIDSAPKRYMTRSKSRKRRRNESESDPGPLQIDVDTDTEADEVPSQAVGTEKKENSLTRDDTVILSSTAQSVAPISSNSSLTESDTLIIPSTDGAMPKSGIVSSTGISVEPCSISVSGISHLNKLFSSSTGGHIITQPALPSMSSIPSLVLTESMVEGTINPTLICDLLSQSSEHSNSICIQPLNSVSANESTALQITTQATSSPTTSKEMETQTDWVFGNVQLPVTIFNNTVQPVADNTVAESREHVQPEGIESAASEKQVDDENPFPCATCEERFSSKQALKKHEKEAHKTIFMCDLCSSTFTTAGNYTRHKKIHDLKPGQKRYFCKECQREFLQRCDLKRHLLIHSNQQPHRCKICDKGYIRRSDLVVHMRFHNKEKNYGCHLCGKKYFQSGDLSRHIRRVHKTKSELTCGHCDRKYACENTLIRHMKQVHKDIIMQTVQNDAEEK